MLEMDPAQGRCQSFVEWAVKTKECVDVALFKSLDERRTKLPFPLPASWLLITPLAIDAAASGAQLTAFRDPTNYDSLMTSFI